MTPFHYLMPTEIIFGEAAIDQLSGHAAGLGNKALIVTGRTSARASGALDRALAQLPGALVFDEVEENPTTDTCARGADLCRQHECGFVVGIGGGSPMDAAKAIAVLARNTGPCESFFGAGKFDQGNLPVLAIPTTAGTGSEVTPYAVLVDTKANTKKTIKGAGIFPRAALLDPALSLTMPPGVTVNTGLDALSQAMEGMVSRKSTPLGDALALEACRIIRQWLPVAFKDPGNIQARAHMLYAAMLTGCIIAQSGTTLVHGMGYYFTLEHGLAHGLANGLLLTPLFRYNARQVPDKVAALAQALGHPAEPTPRDAEDKITRALHQLLQQVEVSPAAQDFGVDATRMRAFAESIFPDRGRFKNQPGEPTLDDVTAFFQDACSGRTG